MPQWLTNIPADFWSVLTEMAPYLLLGFLAAGALSVLVAPEFIERHLGAGGIWPVAKAAAFGVPLPLCSCGVIPVAASLRRHGASRGATVGFLISTPQTGVDSIFVTLSLLGGVFAIFRPLAALVSGIIGGAVVSAATGDNGDQAAPDEPAAQCKEACCTAGGPKLSRALSYGFVTLPRDIGWALVGGLAIAAVISAAVPSDFFAGILGGGIGAMLVMMALGVPVYVCATASVPVAAALIAKGVSPGAALVFLMTGPATNAATIATVWRVLGRRTAILYLLTVALSALGAGLALDYIFNVGQITAAPAMGWMLPGYVKAACAVVLVAVLAYAVLSRRSHTHAHEHADRPPDATIAIKGMTCSHCAQSVRRAVLACRGAEAVEVDLPAGRAVISGNDLDLVEIAEAVRQLGYRVVGQPQKGQ